MKISLFMTFLSLSLKYYSEVKVLFVWLNIYYLFKMKYIQKAKVVCFSCFSSDLKQIVKNCYISNQIFYNDLLE